MTRKFGEARRAAFLRALAESGNQTLAAERAKVSRSWVHLHRSGDADFRAACDAAVAGFRERAGSAREAGAGTVPGPGWRTQLGAQLVVRGSNGRRCQVARSRLKQWDAAAEDAFLNTLRVTANVKAACLAAGLSAPSAYEHRKRHRHFAALWKAALKEGYSRIEALVIERAVAAANGRALETMPDAPETMPPISFDDAMQVLRLYMPVTRPDRTPPGRKPWKRRRTFEEVRESLLKKVEAVRRYHGLPPGEGAPPDPVLRGRG